MSNRKPVRRRKWPRSRCLTHGEILGWADAFHMRRGRWPKEDDGTVLNQGITWIALSLALKRGYHSLPGGTTLAELLRVHRGKRKVGNLPSLKVTEILRWADDHHSRTGCWPNAESGEIPDTLQETWLSVEESLRNGTRGLSVSSLAQLLQAHRGVRNPQGQPSLTHEQILEWADAHFARTGSWPSQRDGQIVGDETWGRVNEALLIGYRGLEPGWSLARLFAEHRGVRNRGDVPRLTPAMILRWADAHHTKTGKWPVRASGTVESAPGETWLGIHKALQNGGRGLPGDDSLPCFLARHRGKRHREQLPPLKVEQIRKWIVAYRRRTGKWPGMRSGAIPESPGDTWSGVARSLWRGKRGLPAGLTIARVRDGREPVPNV
jgi:hypothetical protein